MKIKTMVIIAVCAVAVGLFYHWGSGVKARHLAWHKACIEAGGVPMYLRDARNGRVCFDSNVIIEVK